MSGQEQKQFAPRIVKMTTSLLTALRRISKTRVVGIAEVNHLLSMDWQGFLLALPAPTSGEAQTIHVLLRSLREEFEEGYWDGKADEDITNRIGGLINCLESTLTGPPSDNEQRIAKRTGPGSLPGSE